MRVSQFDELGRLRQTAVSWAMCVAACDLLLGVLFLLSSAVCIIGLIIIIIIIIIIADK